MLRTQDVFLLLVRLLFLFLWPSSVELYGSNEVVNCNEVYSIEESLNGTIETLGYPNPYPQRRWCKVQLKGDDKHRVMLRFKDFYLFHPMGQQHRRKHASCDGLDTLRIYDGLDDDAKLLGEFCGAHSPLPLMSSGPHLSLNLTSYTSGEEARGFSASYSFVDNFGITSGKQTEEGKCEFIYDSNDLIEGRITSPNPSGLYPSNTNCTYIFDGSFLQRVYFKFLHFDLEGLEPCTARSGSDFLEFSNLKGFDPCPVRRCGRFQPQEVISEDSYFRITFRSNDRLSGFGFSASFRFVMEEEIPEWASYLRSSADSSKPASSCLLLIGLLLPCLRGG